MRAAQPELMTTAVPGRMGPCAASNASMSAGSTTALGSAAAFSRMSMTATGSTSRSMLMSAADSPPGTKCSGASKCVPACSKVDTMRAWYPSVSC